MAKEPDADVIAYYEKDQEHSRLVDDPIGRLELARTKRLLQKVLPPGPARILDVGGAAGIYASWLIDLGHQVEVIDLTPLHVDRCAASGIPAEVGDARHLRRDDATYDVVLLLGPLYHLPDRADRDRALAEAHRVLRRDGVVAAAAISRFAGFVDGMRRQLDLLLTIRPYMERLLGHGQHVNPERIDGLFTTAYFHRPDELRPELETAGFVDVDVRAIECVGWVLPDLDAIDLDVLCELLDAIDAEPSLLGASSHLLATGRRA